MMTLLGCIIKSLSVFKNPVSRLRLLKNYFKIVTIVKLYFLSDCIILLNRKYILNYLYLPIISSKIQKQ